MVKQTKNKNSDMEIISIRLCDLRETNREEYKKLFPLVISHDIKKNGIKKVIKEMCPYCLISLREYLISLIDSQIIKNKNDLKNKN